jgi:hypothetical protein
MREQVAFARRRKTLLAKSKHRCISDRIASVPELFLSRDELRIIAAQAAVLILVDLRWKSIAAESEGSIDFMPTRRRAADEMKSFPL